MSPWWIHWTSDSMTFLTLWHCMVVSIDTYSWTKGYEKEMDMSGGAVYKQLFCNENASCRIPGTAISSELCHLHPSGNASTAKPHMVWLQGFHEPYRLCGYIYNHLLLTVQCTVQPSRHAQLESTTYSEWHRVVCHSSRQCSELLFLQLNLSYLMHFWVTELLQFL